MLGNETPYEVSRTDLGTISTRAAQRNPDGTAFIDSATGQRTTFGEFDELASSCVDALRSRGLNRGDSIAIVSTNSVEMYVVHFAALKAGIVTLYLNVHLPRADLAYQLDDAEADAIYFESAFAEKVKPYLDANELDPVVTPGPTDIAGGVDLSTLVGEGEPTELESETAPGDPAVLLYTSGTTAKPKGVLHTHHSYNYGVINTLVGGDVRRNDVQTAVLPLFHIHQDLWTKAALCVGATTVLYDSFEPPDLLASIEAEGVTYVNLMESMYRQLFEADISTTDLSSVRRCVYGMPMETNLRERVAEVFGADLQKVYGQTEALIATFLDPEWQFEKLGNYVGQATPFMEVAVMNEDGDLVDQGETGEIVLRGPSVMDRYLNLPEATADTWRDRWHHTEDLGRIDEDGLLFFVDRKKSMIKTGGENVSSIKVENCLGEHPLVDECAVVGLPHEVWGEAITGFVTTSTDRDVAEELETHCQDRLASFERPKSIIVLNEFPYTSTGKITKSQLGTDYQDYYRNDDR